MSFVCFFLSKMRNCFKKFLTAIENGAKKICEISERSKIIVPLYALVVCTVSFYLTVKFLIAFWMHCVCTGNPQSVAVFITLFGIEAGIMAYLSWLCDWLYSKPLYKIISELLGKVICRIRHV